MDVRQHVLDTILSFEGFFTVEDIWKKLEKEIDIEANKKEILDALDDIFQTLCNIRQVPFTNKYYVEL